MGKKGVYRLIIVGLVLLRCTLATLTIAVWIIVPITFLDIMMPSLLSEHLVLFLTMCALAGVVADIENSRLARRWWKSRHVEDTSLTPKERHND